MRRRIKVIYVNKLLIPHRGICLAPFCILIKKKYQGNFGLLRHEIIHYKQYKRMGFIMFYLRWILQLLLFGYNNMPMELEAKQGENWYGIWNYTQKHKINF